MHGKGFELFETKVSEKFSTHYGVGFDFTIILSILTAILPLIQNCFKPKPTNLRQGFGRRARVAAALRREMNIPFAKAFEYAERIMEAADEATDEELESFISDCCGDAK